MRTLYRWGILGTGTVAGQFAAQLDRCNNASLQAVASRNGERARAAALSWGAKVSYGSYEALIADREIDIVYVATPASMHLEHCLIALNAGKSVLCEKPFALTAADARVIVSAAKRANVFCMEAMWMRFNPLVQELREQVQNEELGPVHFFTANLGYRTATSRFNNADPGRGALLNFGVYGVSLAHFLFGPPRTVLAETKHHQSGLDMSFSASLGYPDLVATVQCSIGATMTNDAVVIGPKGRVRLGAPFINPGSLQWTRVGEPQATPSASRKRSSMAEKLPFISVLQDNFLITLLRKHGYLTIRPSGVNGLKLEADEVMRCLTEGKRESAIMPLTETVAVMETLDKIRATWNS